MSVGDKDTVEVRAVHDHVAVHAYTAEHEVSNHPWLTLAEAKKLRADLDTAISHVEEFFENNRADEEETRRKNDLRDQAKTPSWSLFALQASGRRSWLEPNVDPKPIETSNGNLAVLCAGFESLWCVSVCIHNTSEDSASHVHLGSEQLRELIPQLQEALRAIEIAKGEQTAKKL